MGIFTISDYFVNLDNNQIIMSLNCIMVCPYYVGDIFRLIFRMYSCHMTILLGWYPHVITARTMSEWN